MEFIIRGRGFIGADQNTSNAVEDIEKTVVLSRDGIPVRVRDLGVVQVGPDFRRGAIDLNGTEAVGGVVVMRFGENPRKVIDGIKAKIRQIEPSLKGVTINGVYDRTHLVHETIQTLTTALTEEILITGIVILLFLLHVRASIVVAATLPIAVLMAFIAMNVFGVDANIMSLAGIAIAIGTMVDMGIIVSETIYDHLAEWEQDGKPGGSENRVEIINSAAAEVRKPTMFGELIIMIVYLPILTLEGIEGKLFRPMALTVIFALAGSMVLSLTLMPVLASYVLPKHLNETEPFLIRWAKRLYHPVLHFTMRQKTAVIGFALCVLVLAFGFVAPNLGSEFVPKLSEGALAINVVRLAGTELEDSIRYNTQMERAVIAAFPDEVIHAWSRIGSAEVATDPMGLELTDLFITLRPRKQWTRANTQAELTELIQHELRAMPGQRIAMTQPIEMRINEMISGVRSDVAAVLYGDDFDVLVEKAREIERVLSSINGNADVATEQVTGQPVLEIKVKQDEIARYGISADTVLNLVESLGTLNVGEVFEGQLRFPLVIRLPEEARANPEVIGSIPIATPAGEQIPLSRLASITVREGPSTIKREWYQRRISITSNVRGRDMGSFVAEARQKVASEVQLPPGRYRVEWGGQFENLERARKRLLIVVPIVLMLIFGLLYMTYNNVIDAIRVFTGVPFAWTGGIFALWIRDMPFSISAAVGFIALSGVAVLDDMLLVSTIQRLRKHGMDLESAVEEAALTRLRPVLMTTLVAALGFVPMAFNTGMGAEVQRPLATVVIGGVISATIMSLLVLRVLYMVFAGPVGRKEHRNQPATEDTIEERQLVGTKTA
ncbi:UNVERIFIED_CONTAM: hypothetical protein GTU68_053495 [Idotea baltica]|nr:hypothetical protein [Idotea baltica]